MKAAIIAITVAGIAAVGGAVGYIIAPSPIEPSPRPTATVTADPTDVPFEESDHFPYSDPGWSRFFGNQGNAVVEGGQDSPARRLVDCRDLRLPLFEGRVNMDAVEYFLDPDSRVIAFTFPFDFSKGDRWVAYRDRVCLRRLSAPIRDVIRDALANFRHSGLINSGHPDGP